MTWRLPPVGSMKERQWANVLTAHDSATKAHTWSLKNKVFQTTNSEFWFRSTLPVSYQALAPHVLVNKLHKGPTASVRVLVVLTLFLCCFMLIIHFRQSVCLSACGNFGVLGLEDGRFHLHP